MLICSLCKVLEIHLQWSAYKTAFLYHRGKQQIPIITKAKSRIILFHTNNQMLQHQKAKGKKNNNKTLGKW